MIVRGRTDEGADLVISPDYIREGLRARAGHLVTLELGPRTDAELRRRMDLQIGADRWTSLVDFDPEQLSGPWSIPRDALRSRNLVRRSITST